MEAPTDAREACDVGDWEIGGDLEEEFGCEL
jgi:hypothetical protein